MDTYINWYNHKEKLFTKRGSTSLTDKHFTQTDSKNTKKIKKIHIPKKKIHTKIYMYTKFSYTNNY